MTTRNPPARRAPAAAIRVRRRLPDGVGPAIPGVYQGPGGRAYLYYGDEDKTFIPGVTVSIEPKERSESGGMDGGRL